MVRNSSQSTVEIVQTIVLLKKYNFTKVYAVVFRVKGIKEERQLKMKRKLKKSEAAKMKTQKRSRPAAKEGEKRRRSSRMAAAGYPPQKERERENCGESESGTER